jgi:hypothetical protein
MIVATSAAIHGTGLVEVDILLVVDVGVEVKGSSQNSGYFVTHCIPV